MEKEPTNLELLNSIQNIVDVKVDGVNTQLLEAIQDSAFAMSEFATTVDQRFDRIEGRLTRLETTVSMLPTKAYMDDKFADEGSRYGSLIRESTEKTHALTDALVAERSLTPEASSRITAMPPFPRRARRS